MSEPKHAPAALPAEAETHAQAHQHPGEGTYVNILIILAGLTLLEVIAAYLPVIRYPLLIGISFSKAWLVIRFYMHLRYEKPLLTVVFLFPLIAATIITVVITPLVR